jgi:predicted solute-binding protein
MKALVVSRRQLEILMTAVARCHLNGESAEAASQKTGIPLEDVQKYYDSWIETTA